jgi:hypothetical protein
MAATENSRTIQEQTNETLRQEQGQQVAAYFKELNRRNAEIQQLQINRAVRARRIGRLLEEEAAESSESKKKASYASWLSSNTPKILAAVMTTAALFISTVSIAASYPLWPAIALIGLTAISSQGIIKFIDGEETFSSTPLPTQPLSDLWHTATGADAKQKAAAWEKFKQSLPQVIGALTLGIAIGWATFTELSSGGLLPIPFPAAIALAAVIGMWNYALGAGAFAPAKTSTDKQVTFVGKLKDYWHQFKTENKWERTLRIMGHTLALGAGLALLATMTAGTGGAFFYVMLAAGAVQIVGLQRTGVPHAFVRTGAALLRPFGVKINSPATKVELAWSLAPKKTKIITLLGVSIAMSTTMFMMIQGFAAVGVFASIGFPPAAAAVVTATFLGILTYHLLQRFYFSRLPAKKQKYFEDMAYADKRQDTLNRTAPKISNTLEATDKTAPANAETNDLGWTASSESILSTRISHCLNQDFMTRKAIRVQEAEAKAKAEAAEKAKAKPVAVQSENHNPFSFHAFKQRLTSN